MEIELVLIHTIAALGFISLSRTLVKFCSWIWITFLRPPKNLKAYGSWAIVTGSTDGIGKALAFELASEGFNLILTGRNLSKLEKTSKDIREEYGKIGIKVKCVVIDFCKETGVKIVEKIKKEIYGLDIGILVNNAGMAYPFPKYFHEVELSLIDNVIGVNIEAVTWVTKAVLPCMLKKKKGAILNIGSAGSSPIAHTFPLYAVYTASKAYLGTFSRSIGLEYKGHGIDVQCQIPLLVATKMTPMTKSSFFIPSPEMYSQESVRWIGYEHTCMPYWTHCVRWWFQDILPEAWLNKIFLHYILKVREDGALKMFCFDL